MRKTLIATALALGLVAVPATSAFATTDHRYVGIAKTTLTVTDSTAGSFTIDGTAKIRKIGAATVHGEGVRTDANSASYSLTITTASGDTITTTNTANGLRAGRSGLFSGHTTITGGTGAYAGATGSARSLGVVKKIKATPGSFKAKVVFQGTINF